MLGKTFLQRKKIVYNKVMSNIGIINFKEYFSAKISFNAKSIIRSQCQLDLFPRILFFMIPGQITFILH